MQSVALTKGDACFENLQALDRKLSRAARVSGPLRFALGTGLNALAASGGHAALGFSTLEDYGRERCEYGATALGQARCLARRTSTLPRLREALISGRISWSMAKVIARVAKPENEEKLLQLAARRTVGRMKDLLAAEVAQDPDDAFPAEPDPDSLCTLTITENHEDALLFECAHTLARHLGANTMTEVVEALVSTVTKIEGRPARLDQVA